MHSQGQEQGSGEPQTILTPEIDGRKARVDELADRLRAANADPTLVSILLDQWQRAVGTIAIVLLGFWLYNEYQARQTEQVGELSRRFDEARRSLVTLTVEREAPENQDPAAAEQAKKDLDTAIKGANDTFDLLKTTGSGTAYSNFAEIYSGLTAAYQGQPEEAIKRLAVFKPEQYFSATEASASAPVHGAAVTQEAAALLTARLGAEKDPELARKQLSSLALSAQYVNSEALLSLFRLIQTGEQRTVAEAVAHKVVLARPEQLDQIQSDLAPFGFKP